MNLPALSPAAAPDWARVRTDFPLLERRVHGKPLVYFDSANTSQKPRQVVDAIAEHYLTHNANVARAMHTLGAEASEAFEDARMKFDVRYYLIAILFILFDLEVAFLFPWATIFKDIVATESIKMFGFVEMLVFVAILVVGYIYAWAKGALDWE